MVTPQTHQRAWLLPEVRAETGYLAQDIHDALKHITPPPDNHRIATLINSLAWHPAYGTRADPQEVMTLRLQALHQELVRLRDKLTETSPAEAALYQMLLEKLGFVSTDEPVWTVALPTRLPGRPGQTEAEQQAWAQHARLLLAQTALHLLQTLLRSRQLQHDIDTRGGSIQWQ
jgi:hypothetical protein